jgi:uncharacterized protein YutE (UPF0331/DUF86 family)
LVDRSVFDLRLAKLEQLLENLEQLAVIERSDFLADPAVQAQAERWLHLAAECALDLANHLIADRGWRTPTTNRESFQVLAEQRALPNDLAERMEGWAGFRNILVHLYLEIDHDTVFDILTRDLDELRSYAAKLAEVAFGGED